MTWVTASTALRPRIRGKGTPDDQAYDSEQTSFLEPGSRPHKGTAIVITSRATKQQPFYCKALFWQSHRPWAHRNNPQLISDSEGRFSYGKYRGLLY